MAKQIAADGSRNTTSMGVFLVNVCFGRVKFGAVWLVKFSKKYTVSYSASHRLQSDRSRRADSKNRAIRGAKVAPSDSPPLVCYRTPLSSCFYLKPFGRYGRVRFLCHSGTGHNKGANGA